MITVVKYIIYRVKKLQKSQRRVFFRAVWRIALVWILTGFLITWIFCANQTAGPDNTCIVIVSGDSVSLRIHFRGPDSIFFTDGDDVFYSQWGSYANMNSRQAIESLSQEEAIQLTILLESQGFRTTGKVVDVKGRTKHYLDIEDYNRSCQQIRIIGPCVIVLFAVFATFLFSFDIFHYLKLEGLKYFDPAKNR